MEILAHRCNEHGSVPNTENTVATLVSCFKSGFGVETDIRRWPDGEFYISHDQRQPEAKYAARPFLQIMRTFPGQTVALNIKEIGYERDLLALLCEYQVGNQVFLFDMDLIEPVVGDTSKLYRQFDANIAIAARVSDRGETVNRALSIREASVVWLDEFDRLWVQQSDIDRLKAAGKKVYVVSPELHHFPVEQMVSRWQDILNWQIDGLCTDYPVMFRDYLSKGLLEVP
jgi:glycerophosphoryl diester phosphodiesterase